MYKFFKTISIFYFFPIVFSLLGCSDYTPKNQNSNASNSQELSELRQFYAKPEIPESRVIARIRDNDITLEDIDESIELEIFDYLWEIYNLRKLALAMILEEKGIKDQDNEDYVSINFDPPMPPRIELPETNENTLGAVALCLYGCDFL